VIWNPFRRLPRAAPLVLGGRAARELLTLWPGAKHMNDAVNLQPAMIVLVEKLQTDRAALQGVLSADPHNFPEQNRLLGDFQSAVRSLDILQRAVEAPAEHQRQIETSILPVLTRASAALTDEDRERAMREAGLMGTPAAVGDQS
jgi:hypothetical protein